MKRVTASASVCVLVVALLVICGCSSERDKQSRLDRLNSEEWYLDDSVQRGLPGGPREPEFGQDPRPLTDTEKAKQDTASTSQESDSSGSP